MASSLFMEIYIAPWNSKLTICQLIVYRGVTSVPSALPCYKGTSAERRHRAVATKQTTVTHHYREILPQKPNLLERMTFWDRDFKMCFFLKWPVYMGMISNLYRQFLPEGSPLTCKLIPAISNMSPVTHVESPETQQNSTIRTWSERMLNALFTQLWACMPSEIIHLQCGAWGYTTGKCNVPLNYNKCIAF